MRFIYVAESGRCGLFVRIGSPNNERVYVQGSDNRFATRFTYFSRDYVNSEPNFSATPA